MYSVGFNDQLSVRYIIVLRVIIFCVVVYIMQNHLGKEFHALIAGIGGLVDSVATSELVTLTLT